MTEENHDSSEKFNASYSEIAASLASASTEIQSLHISNEEGRSKREELLATLRGTEERFAKDLEMLRRNAEWDKLNVAFFGETNAGKSTVIEALRILLDEKQRRSLLESNHHDLRRFEGALTAQAQRVEEAVAERERAIQRGQEAFLASQRRAMEVFRTRQSALLRDAALEHQRSIAPMIQQIKALGTVLGIAESKRIKKKMQALGLICLALGAAIGAFAVYLSMPR